MQAADTTHVFQLEEAFPLLQAAPGVLRAFLENLPDAWLHFQENPEAWSPYTVLVHMVHNETNNWIPRMRVLLSEEVVRKFPPFNQLPGDSERGPEGVPALLEEFTRLRRENLVYLRGLSLGPAQLDREAEHPSLGTVTLRNLLATWVVHDLNHLHQIAKSLAKRYQAPVGPWRQYLGILEL